ncbi:DUF6548 family protein [Pseudoflavonifractor phocaeensis]|uniref:DUF6548 family protein n=1 Tax=Pseudoflavonifractor phocaeensis TaxID=1870988 RepID=UPI0019576ACC|nr:DUF6548 family protein [Pseudoflavonifractor phocaeensis]MBM6869801.1 hypothetical protein [Pseudoflavonifractor phocaeensis]
MGFMQSYKRLDMLCRDMNGIGVTGYIEDMERAVNGAHYVSGWHSDYRKLKHYRYIRNQIAHEVCATEENMCSSEDIAWVETFYQHILQQTDPLAMYYREISQRQKTEAASARKSSKRTDVPHNAPPARRSSPDIVPNYVVALMIGMIALVVMLLLYYYAS